MYINLIQNVAEMPTSEGNELCSVSMLSIMECYVESLTLASDVKL